MSLSDTTLRSLKPVQRPTKLFDGNGLFLLLKPGSARTPKGARLWRLKYYFAGKEKLLALGSYPEVSLKLARELRDKARALLAQSIDPSEHKRDAAAALQESTQNSFESIAREWFGKQTSRFRPTTFKKAIALMEKWVFPWIGRRPIAAVTAKELFNSVLRRVEEAGKIETASRVKQRCGQVFSYAVRTGRAQFNPADALRGALTTAKARNHSAIIEPVEVAPLLRAIDGFAGQFITRCALKLSPLLFVRPGELRRAEWSEIDFENAMWSIAASKMKMAKPHLVPLSRQALAIFKELHQLTGSGRYVFPGSHGKDRPMSENTVNGALRRLGYTGAEMVAHGFRTTASTNLNERGWRYDVIERQLAHVERSDSRRPYNRAEYLPERIRMMQAWADFLDALRLSSDTGAISAAITGLSAAAQDSITPRTT